MTNSVDATQEWWRAVHCIADLVNREGVQPGEDQLIRTELAELGFSADGIGRALDWVDMASLSGNLMDTLGMLQEVSPNVRIDHPLERASIHPLLRRAVYACRRRGLITQDLAERLIEGLRTLDTRDWDEHEIESYLAEVLAVMPLGSPAKDLAALLVGRGKDQFN